ncbi:MAG TPA: hypothetical protein VMS17_07910, partial [Gemmataceae bacterium]|nr:hypothetical protein [Gemmataceae bacterium]
SLVAAVVMKALNKGPEGQTLTEIADLDMQLKALRQKFGLDYLPSCIHLSKQNNYNRANKLDQDSMKFLQKRFGTLCCYSTAGNYFPALNGNTFIDWNGDGVANEELYLEGEQCLVWLLGGVPLTSGGQIKMIGFSTNVTNPALMPQSQGERRDGPYYEFKTERLVSFVSGLQGNTAKAAFPVYIDGWYRAGVKGAVAPYGVPYAFLSGYGTETGNYQQYSGLASSDCPSLGITQPYYISSAPTIVYVNGSTWQIISAGNDGTFGPGGQWNSSTGLGPASGVAGDDQSNFARGVLRAPAN